MHIKYTNLIVRLSISNVYLLELTVNLSNHLKLFPNTKIIIYPIISVHLINRCNNYSDIYGTAIIFALRSCIN